MPETAWSSGATATTAVTVVYGDEPSPNTLEVTYGDTKVSITSPTSSSTTQSGNITITYTLSNSESETSSVKPQYSTDGGTNYSNMTDAGGASEGKTGLSTSPSGTTHTFIWASATDAGLDHKGAIDIKIIAYDDDGYKGDVITSDEVTIVVDNSPQAPTLVTPADGYFRKDDTPLFVFTIPNPRAGNSKLHFKLQLDTANTFNTSNLLEFESRNEQTGWEYYNGSAWVAIPVGGIDIPTDPTLIGNQARFTIQDDDRISRLTYEWRVIAGGVTS